MISKENPLCLDGKVAVISGGAAGIGFATGKLLAEYGAKVVLLDVNKELGNKAVKEIEDEGGTAIFIKCDVTSNEECKETIGKVDKRFGRIDILFNNAGVTFRKTVVELEEKEWDLVIGVGLKGTYLLSKYTIPIMARGGGGSIVNTGSGWGLKGGDKAAAYCAVKGGIVNLTRAMAIDHGPQNIRVNSVNPGDTDTAMLRSEGEQLGFKSEIDKFLVDSAKGRPLERLGTPLDIAKAVLFLSSDLASWITGTALVVDGGGIA
ncbi:Dehydrogenases with different specificities (Related to short-chain alcohol dehydrogenases) [[Clostridium] ultunense Esp]|uniref:Dehydrogenases with different specificities (Related to short-chain alcohol dehydrogenases) n=1 Tax=[Clostridium] ultunense Esp TaxID=1288971 RepID=M1Z9N3_9FIRM|nr:glucose 1-dehydrogenase [Schnuerera ultunensis]CCQ94544.1 Dehydrogenases with different specificities (Related to short-chain alcohol dehydrogenases) [[Clostridium] ultunense Esp]SHD76495.1 Dehydrogenases with different specificities (Related to short-chain alcohol dehydrogenases) [[Clostridium] ultunense Esp]